MNKGFQKSIFLFNIFLFFFRILFLFFHPCNRERMRKEGFSLKK
uniref:Uncharacterized protein n=1 Tax=Saccharum officinarum TaxID=4547 RepID=A0A286R4M1_SACOF|nr:hypothetical protein SaofCp006 [Saccharum hybrid cultivar NCo 310]ASV52234.1 hypothetical protein [Saccharum officinarum]BAD27275.1 hypothetical protein [Saccharum hybrid cultivar NCo 310]